MIDTREELIDAALELVAPKAADRARCRQQIVYCSSIGQQLIAARDDPTPGEWRKEIAAYVVAARRFHAATKNLSRRSSAVLLQDPDSGDRVELVLLLKAIVDRADNLVESGIPVKAAGNSRRDPVMIAAAAWARRLLNDFSEKRPSKTSDGPFQQLTRLLYEFVSGCQPISVERACDDELRRSEAATRDKQALK